MIRIKACEYFAKPKEGIGQPSRNYYWNVANNKGSSLCPSKKKWWIYYYDGSHKGLLEHASFAKGSQKLKI